MKTWVGSENQKVESTFFFMEQILWNYFYGTYSLSLMNSFSEGNFCYCCNNDYLFKILRSKPVLVYNVDSFIGGFFKSALFLTEILNTGKPWEAVSQLYSSWTELASPLGILFYSQSPLQTCLDWHGLRCSQESFIFRSLTGEEYRGISHKGEDQAVNESCTHSGPCSKFHGYS